MALVEDEPWYDLEWALADLTDRAADYKLYRDYYDGNHRPVLSTDEFHNAFQRVFAEFRDNLCPRVVDGKVDRLQLQSFGGDQDLEALRKAGEEVWERNMLNRRQGEVHMEAMKMGDSFVIIWPDDEDDFPIWYPQKAEQVAVRWNEDSPGKIDLAAKAWRVRGVKGYGYWRVNLYYEDRIEKYQTIDKPDTRQLPDKQNQWEQHPEEGEPFPLPHDLGRVPVFSWNNNAPLGEYGKSELKDAIPLQNALNKANLDLLAAMEFAALPQRWATGITVEIDPNTKQPKKPWQPGADRILTTGNPNARFGDFGQANLEQLLRVVDDRRLEMARVTSTPMHWLSLGRDSGSMPSGVALRVSEGPLTALIKDRIDTFGSPWEEAMAFSLELMGHGEEARLAANWANPVQIDPKELVEEAKLKKDIGVPDDQLFRELGYDEDQIAAFVKQAEDRRAEMQAQFAGAVPEEEPEDEGDFGA